MDYLVKKLLSFAWAISEFDFMAKITTKEQSKYRIDS